MIKNGLMQLPHMHTHTHMHAHMHTHMHAHMHTHMHAHMHAHMHTPNHQHTHTHTHTHTLMFIRLQEFFAMKDATKEANQRLQTQMMVSWYIRRNFLPNIMYEHTCHSTVLFVSNICVHCVLMHALMYKCTHTC